MMLVRPRAIVLAVAAVALPFASSAPASAGNACIAAFEANFNLHSYRATMTTSQGTQRIDLVVPDRVHVVGKDMEIIAIGSRSWMRMGGAGWRSLPGAGLPTASIFATARQNLEANKAGSICVDRGLTSYGGRPAHLFTFSHLGANGTSSGKAYVFDDGYVHHIETSGPTGTVVLDFSKLNAVSVSPP